MKYTWTTGLAAAIVFVGGLAMQLATAQPFGEYGDMPPISREDILKGIEDFKKMREKQNQDALKKELGTTNDEEFKKLQDLIKAVTDIQALLVPPAVKNNPHDLNNMAKRFEQQLRNPQNQGPAAIDPDTSTAPAPPAPPAIVTAGEALEKLRNNPEAKPEDIKAALAAYRTEREKLQKELEAARKKLKAAVNLRQETALVLKGVLE